MAGADLKSGLFLPCRGVVSNIRDQAGSVVRWRGGDVHVRVHAVAGAGAVVAGVDCGWCRIEITES